MEYSYRGITVSEEWYKMAKDYEKQSRCPVCERHIKKQYGSYKKHTAACIKANQGLAD